METEVFNLEQPHGFYQFSSGAERILIQLLTTGVVEIVVAQSTPPTDQGQQGFILTERGEVTFSVTGLGASDKVFGRIIGAETDTDTVAVLRSSPGSA